MTRRFLTLGVPFAALALAGAPAMAQETLDPAHPVHIHAGACPEPGDVVQGLSDIVSGTDAQVGSNAALPVEVSTNLVPMAFSDIVNGQHAINVHESADAMDVSIACGDIGGMLMGESDLAIGLAEQNGSGHIGSAWLHDNGDGTTRVDVILWSTTSSMPEQSPAPMGSGAPMGSPAASPGTMDGPGASPAAESPAPVESLPATSPAASPAV